MSSSLPRSRAWWRAPVLLGAIAVALRLGALMVHRHLSLDDGAYGVSTVDMRHGLAPYRDLFSSQGPSHYPLLYVGDVLGFRTRNAPRVVPLLSGPVAAIGVWAIAVRLGASARAALGAGVLAATTGSILWVTGPVSADGPALALTVTALWAAIAYRGTGAWWRALLAGALFGAALATKPLVFAAIVPLASWLWSRRRAGDVAAAGVTAIAAWFLAAVPWGVGRVWDQSVRFHLDKGGQSPPLTQLGKLVTTLWSRDLVLITLVALALAGALLARRERASRPGGGDVVVLAGWAALISIVLVFEKLLLVSHVAALVPPLVLLVALRPPRPRWLALALVVVVPVQVFQLSDIISPRGYTGHAKEVVTAMHALPRSALAISDIPGLVWQSGRWTPRLLNDNSFARISTGRETTQMVVAGAADRRTCAVAIWSFRWGEHLPGLREGLRATGYSLARDWGPDQQLWLKTGCDPARRASARPAPVRSRG